MKARLILSVLSLLLLLSACGEEKLPVFLIDDNGYSYVSKETGVCYAALDFCYEPAKKGEAVGAYTDKKSGFTRTFYSVMGMDAALFLTDDDLTVWYAGTDMIDAAAWELAAVLVCEQDAVSAELFRFLNGKDDAEIDEIRTLWFEGEAVEKPLSEIVYYRGIKLFSTAYEGIYYCFDFYVYENGEAVFSAPVSGRTVSVPASLAEKLMPVEEETT